MDEVPSEATLNTHIRDNLLALLHPYHAESSDVTVVNTSAQASLFSSPPVVAGGDLGLNGQFITEMQGIYFHNTANTLTFFIRWGGTSWIACILVNGTPTTYVQPWQLRVTVTNRGSASSQYITAVLLQTANDVPSPTAGYGGAHFGGNVYPTGGVLSADATVDTTLNQTFDVIVQWSAASADNAITRRISRTYLSKQ